MVITSVTCLAILMSPISSKTLKIRHPKASFLDVLGIPGKSVSLDGNIDLYVGTFVKPNGCESIYLECSGFTEIVGRHTGSTPVVLDRNFTTFHRKIKDKENYVKYIRHQISDRVVLYSGENEQLGWYMLYVSRESVGLQETLKFTNEAIDLSDFSGF